MKGISKSFGKLKVKPEGGSKGRTSAEIGAETGTGTVTKPSQATTSTALASSDSFIPPQPPSASLPPAQPAARSTNSETAASATDINITTLPRFDMAQLAPSPPAQSLALASASLTLPWPSPPRSDFYQSAPGPPNLISAAI